MPDGFEYYAVNPAAEPTTRREIQDLLARCGLDYDEHVPTFIVGEAAGRIGACAGLDGNVVKCVAIAPEYQGTSVCCSLLSEVTAEAGQHGHTHLFLYTRPGNADFFRGCGFYPLAEVPGLATLMENTPIGIRSYCERLAALRKPGKRIGAIVMNANPFTLGHEYLARTASGVCDWVHVFLVGEDASLFSYRDRFEMVRQGLAAIPNIIVHPGSPYIISRATFPAYFLKDKASAGPCGTAIDLLLFRDYIAPALGITDRFVGTEPSCTTTEQYNQEMLHFLHHGDSPGLAVVQIERLTKDGHPISASDVRRLLAVGDVARIRTLVPPTTLAFLRCGSDVDPAGATPHDAPGTLDPRAVEMERLP